MKTGDLIKSVIWEGKDHIAVKAGTALRFVEARYGDLAIVLDVGGLNGTMTLKIHHQRRNEIFYSNPNWWEVVE